MSITPLRSHETEEVRPERRAAEILLEQGDLEGARMRLEAYLATEPDDARARGLLGLCCFRLGLLDDAARLYAALVERNPGDATLRVNLGLVALKRGDAAEAAAQFEVAVSLAPAHRKALNYLGLALAQRGELALARDAFEKAGAGAMAERMAAQLAAAEQLAAAKPMPPPFRAEEGASDSGAVVFRRHESAAFVAAAEARGVAGNAFLARAEEAGGGVAATPAQAGPVENISSPDALADRAGTGDVSAAPVGGGATEDDAFDVSAASTGTVAAENDASDVSAGSVGTASGEADAFDVSADSAGPAADVSNAAAGDAAPKYEAFDVSGPPAALAAPDDDAFDVTADVETEPAARFAAPDAGPGAPETYFDSAGDTAAAPARDPAAATAAAAPDLQHADFAGLPPLRWPEGRPFAVESEGATVEFTTEVRTRLDGLVAAHGVAAWTPVQKRYRGAEIDRLFGAGAQQMWRATGGGRLLFHTRGRTFTALPLGGEAYFVEERVFAFEEGVRWENGRLPGQATDLHLVRFGGTGQILVTTDRPLRIERVEGGCLSLPTTGLVGWSGALAPRLVGAEEGPAVPWIELSGSGVVLLVG